ncbi:MAG: DUF3368 domain-containing protein [Pyrinomonadaceae bacterium]
MIVVSDTSPINYLILIGKIEILPVLLGNVVLPNAVFQELRAERTPTVVREFVETPPEWLEVRQVTLIGELNFEGLDPGEKEAILLAEELNADALLVDDLAGRMAAAERGIFVIGTIGILQRADEKGLLDFAEAFGELKAKGFRLSAELEKDILRSGR